MNRVIMENRTILIRVAVVVMIVGIIAVAAWGLKLSIAWAAKMEEGKVVSDEQEQQDPLAAPGGAAIQANAADSAETERLLDSIRIFNTTYMNNVPSKNELDEKQAAILAVNEIQRVFGADLNNTILKIEYRNRAMGLFSGDEEVPESVRETFLEDFKEWIEPPVWSASVSIVDKDKYKDCQTYEEFIDKLDKEFKASGLNYQVMPTDYWCEFNALTGEVSYIFRSAPSEITTPYGQPVYIPEQEGEPLYRDYLRQILPNLAIDSIEIIDSHGYNEKYDREIYGSQTKITMSDGSGFLFESGILCLVKYYPKGVPDHALGH